MSPNKRERDYARRRYEEWQRRQAAARARKRRQQVVAGSVVGFLVIALGVAAAFSSTRNNGSPLTPPTSNVTAPAASPSPTATYTLPSPSLAGARLWTGTITTSAGSIGISLDGAAAPQAVANFVSLAQHGFFTSTPCHRLTTAGIFVLQCGDPTGTGSGGPGYTWGPIENAPANNLYPAGTIAMARASGNGSSMGSQFFLVYQDSTIPADSAGGYTVFGHITSGLGVVQAVAAAGVKGGTSDGAPTTPVTIEGVEVK
ncbi:putative bifunctional phosphatase/peptidyl-prolyl cis-trans isomerase [mine drainage metagenome]|uniref:peptidylprolyl isomerase n=1 Tax=mine drainage metagenome TaxID=410659 RepID=A0A1J5QNR1_9ZZZZ